MHWIKTAPIPRLSGQWASINHEVLEYQSYFVAYLAMLVEAKIEGWNGRFEKEGKAVEGNGRLLEAFGRFPHNVRATSDLPPQTYLHQLDQFWYINQSIISPHSQIINVWKFILQILNPL